MKDIRIRFFCILHKVILGNTVKRSPLVFYPCRFQDCLTMIALIRSSKSITYEDILTMALWAAIVQFFSNQIFAHRTCSILLVYVISRSSRSLRSCVVNCLHCLCVNCGRIFIHCRTASLSFILFIKPPYLLEFFFRIIFSFQNVQRQKLIIISFIFHL